MARFAFLTAVVLGVVASCGAAPSRLQKRAALPDYALKYAPLSHLHSGESWYPTDISEFVTHVVAEDDTGKTLSSSVTIPSLSSFGSNVYLTSKDAVENDPSWTFSAQNKPNSSGLSSAPATIIAVDKGNGVVDVFYFYFYAYDYAEYLDLEFGSHVGDWEHSMVRFTNGVPTNIYLSAHSGGAAYTYSALPASGGRAVTYIAIGTHASYATAGTHQHDAPLLNDYTDNGPLWDVTKNYRGFWYDKSAGTFSSAGGAGTGGSEQGSEGVSWLSYLGRWGDKKYSGDDHGQYCVFDECRYSDGPTGPVDKNLGRTAVCQNESDCTIKTSV